MKIMYYMTGQLCPSEEFMYDERELDSEFVENRIKNKSFVENSEIKKEDLIYLKFLHYNYEGRVQIGELIVNKKIKEKTIMILEELFKNKYQVKSFKLIDDYFENESEDRNEIDNKSIQDNNSYAFFYRKIYGTDRLSKHSYGFAIDINPKENPYLPYVNGEYDYSNLSEEDKYYLEHRDESVNHVITHKSLVYKLFKQNGFAWGGDWEHTKDYQHFEANNE